MIPPIVLPWIASILNRYLQSDLEMQARLDSYSHRVIRITITTFDWMFYIKIEDNGITLLDQHQGPIDAALTASITALTRSALADKISIHKDLEMQGDVALIQAVTNIFKNVEIDWEEYIAAYTGDAIAHGIGNVVRDVKTFHDRLFDTGKLNVKEYLQEEIKLLTHPFAVADFCQDVDEVRNAVDRLEARLTIIEAYVKED